MKPKTIGLILKVCLVCAVLAFPLMFFNMILGATAMIVAVAVLLFVVWKTWKLAQSDPDAFKALSKDEKELGLKDLPAGLIVLLVVTFIIAFLGELRVFSFNPFIEIVLTALVVLLLVYYFFQKRKLRKNMKNAPCWLSSFTQFRESS